MSYCKPHGALSYDPAPLDTIIIHGTQREIPQLSVYPSKKSRLSVSVSAVTPHVFYHLNRQLCRPSVTMKVGAGKYHLDLGIEKLAISGGYCIV